MRQEGCQIKALDRPLILVGVQFDNLLDCTKNTEAQVCEGVPLVVIKSGIFLCVFAKLKV